MPEGKNAQGGEYQIQQVDTRAENCYQVPLERTTQHECENRGVSLLYQCVTMHCCGTLSSLPSIQWVCSKTRSAQCWFEPAGHDFPLSSAHKTAFTAFANLN